MSSLSDIKLICIREITAYMSLSPENNQIRELRERIDDLEFRIDELEDELNKLKRLFRP